MTNIKDVARLADVSISTVSYAFSGKRPISSETKNRIVQAAEDLHYHPNSNAQVLRGARTRIIALSAPIHSYTSTAGYSIFFFEMLKAARRKAYDILLLAGENEEIERVADSHLIDGVILLDVEENDSRVAQAYSLPLPVASIGIPLDSQPVYSVDLNFTLAGYMTIDRAVLHGYQRILFLGARPGAYDAQSNFLMYYRSSVLDNARKKGITILFRPVKYPRSEIIETILDDILTNDTIDAIILNGDAETAPLLVSSLLRRHLRVPEDVAVLSVGSYGNLDSGLVKLDEIPLEPRDACKYAMQAITDFIEGDTSHIGRVHYLTPQYLDRGSF